MFPKMQVTGLNFVLVLSLHTLTYFTICVVISFPLQNGVNRPGGFLAWSCHGYNRHDSVVDAALTALFSSQGKQILCYCLIQP